MTARQSARLSVSVSVSGWARSSEVAAFLMMQLDIQSSRAAAGQRSWKSSQTE